MKRIIATVVFLSAIANVGFAQKAVNANKNGIALEGYDPVSYFQQKPIKGQKDFSTTDNGIVYLFSNRQNEETFRKNPSKYKPQYGGWCAYAMGLKGERVEVDPETYKILDGKLYLFYNKVFNNTLKSWNKDEMNLKNKADANWAKINHQ